MFFIRCYPSVFLKRAISEERTKIFIMMKKVKVKDLKGLDIETISKIETPMVYLGEWEQDGSVFADLRNSKDEPIRIFHERLENYV